MLANFKKVIIFIYKLQLLNPRQRLRLIHKSIIPNTNNKITKTKPSLQLTLLKRLQIILPTFLIPYKPKIIRHQPFQQSQLQRQRYPAPIKKPFNHKNHHKNENPPRFNLTNIKRLLIPRSINFIISWLRLTIIKPQT